MIRAVREELAEVVAAAAPTLTVLDYVPETPPTPSAWVTWPSFIDYTNGTLAGQRPVTIAVTFCVGLNDPRVSQIALDDLMSATIPTALTDHDATAWRWLQVLNLSNVTVDDSRLFADLNVQLNA